jgi:hypothetical protein
LYLGRVSSRCPRSCIVRQLVAALVDTTTDEDESSSSVWVAINRSTNNNKTHPSLSVTHFLASMKQATITTETSVSVSPNKHSELFEHPHRRARGGHRCSWPYSAGLLLYMMSFDLVQAMVGGRSSQTKIKTCLLFRRSPRRSRRDRHGRIGCCGAREDI